MKVSELRNVYCVSAAKHNGKYLLHTKEQDPTSRMVHKYLCSFNFKNGYAWIDGFEKTREIENFKVQVDKFIKSLPYDSEYYMPLYRKECFVHHIIIDYMHSIGFRLSSNQWNIESYVCKNKNLYNFSDAMTMAFKGLTAFGMEDIVPEKVEIMFHTGTWDYSWVSVKCDREPEAIKSAIDGILKPLLIHKSVDAFMKSEDLKNFDGNIDLFLKTIDKKMGLVSENYKNTLKSKLLELAEKL